MPHNLYAQTEGAAFVMRDLKVVNIKDISRTFNEIDRPRPLSLLKNSLNSKLSVRQCNYAHAFIAEVENVHVIGTGSLVQDDKLIVYGLSSGNYAAHLATQLRNYDSMPEGGQIDDECVLLWGNSNFGHWIVTYLLRLTLLWYQSGLREKPLLISKSVPKRFLDWLQRMDLRHYRFVEDGVKVRRLWVPSVVAYRGHYNDSGIYVMPEAVNILRHLLIWDLELPRFPRTRLYLSRDKAKIRRLTNESEFTKALESKGIQRVFMEELPLDNQLDLISRAELIVIHAGGGSPITMFAPRDCKIIELSLPRFEGIFVSHLWAYILGQSIGRIDARPVTQTGPLGIDWDGEID